MLECRLNKRNPAFAHYVSYAGSVQTPSANATPIPNHFVTHLAELHNKLGVLVLDELHVNWFVVVQPNYAPARITKTNKHFNIMQKCQV